MYDITLRDQPVVPRRVTGISVDDKMLCKHPFYVQLPILLGGQHSEGHSALTMWNIIAQAEQNR